MTQAVRVAGGAAAGVAALYYGQVGWKVYESTSESRRIEQQLASEQRAVASAEASSRAIESSVAGMELRVQAVEASLQEVDVQLEAARSQVAKLERQRSGQAKEAAEGAAAIQEGRRRLIALAADMRWHKENATLAQEARQAAEQRVRKATELYNPLRHPLVKELLHQK